MRTQKSRLQAIEVKFLRRTQNLKMQDRMRNEVIRERLELTELNEKPEKQKLSWYGRPIRMENDKQVKRIWEAKIEGRNTKNLMEQQCTRKKRN
ncbi:hypothetical protein ILUMI_21318 [Ignelater luminosus]|uniref:Uncharacterized protein n=1 Tax=Ignelater luminosus TaxID=2038154 RepID=A0A8K0CFT0_IGNLU|nr:hypothetical protein ILUMI_21318 [Ignelater luminosus]